MPGGSPLPDKFMPFKIINKQIISPGIKRLVISAQDIARRARAGQYVGAAPEEGDERIPLSIVEADPLKGTITLIVQDAGLTSKKLTGLSINEEIYSLIGPLGLPASIEKKGVVVCIATGIGTAQILFMARALKNAGNKIIGVIGARTKKALMLETQMRLACHKIFITTDDGTYERRGLATDVLKTLLAREDIHLVYAIGSIDMMQTAVRLTKEKNIPTYVSVSPVMVDCMGMCGACRIKVAGDMVLACVEGPLFDGHKVDFDVLNMRMNAYKENQPWRSQLQPHGPKTNEPKIFKRFLSGILRS